MFPFDMFARMNQVLTKLVYLPKVLKPIDADAPWSELNPGNYESTHHFTLAVIAAVFPTYAPFREVPHLPYEVPENEQMLNDNEAWFFLNGICTNISVLRLNGKALADLFHRKIFLMHNPSDGILLDLLECAAGRTMQPVSTLEASVAEILEDALKTHKKVILIAHSQGGIIATGALEKLSENLKTHNLKLLSNLEVYTFASAATEFKFPKIYSEHFSHSHDYVAQIGVIGNSKNFSGRKFEYAASGHLLNTHYLKHFSANKFLCLDAEKSRLTQKVNGLAHQKSSRVQKKKSKEKEKLVIV